MLTLSRKAGQSIQIGRDIVVHVQQLKGTRVRLSIDAPRDAHIVRSELLHSDEPPPKKRAA